MKHSIACSAVSVIGAVWLALFPVPFLSAQVNWGMGEQVLEHVSKGSTSVGEGMIGGGAAHLEHEQLLLHVRILGRKETRRVFNDDHARRSAARVHRRRAGAVGREKLFGIGGVGFDEHAAPPVAALERDCVAVRDAVERAQLDKAPRPVAGGLQEQLSEKNKISGQFRFLLLC